MSICLYLGKKSPSAIYQHLFTLNAQTVVLYNCITKGITIMGFVLGAQCILALLSMSSCSHCWKEYIQLSGPFI